MRLILFVALILPAYAFCQAGRTVSFGKVDKADLQLNTCDFDKDAEAIILSDYGQYYLDFNNNYLGQELRRHVRIKILNDKGLNKANVKLRFTSYKGEEKISNLSANTYNLDALGNIITTKLEKSLVYEKKITSKISEQSFTMPDAKAGSIIEFKYTVVGGGAGFWRLQEDIPVKYSKYEINFPSFCDLFIRPLCSLPYDSKDKSTGDRTIKVFSMENIPALRDEKYITCEQDYVQRIESYIRAFTIQGIRYPVLKTWPEVARQLLDDEDFGRQLGKEIPRTADLDAELKGLTTSYQKMIAVHNYVRRNMKWDGVNNIWAINGVKSAWKEKTGTSGEINLILVNLLKDAGIKAYPIMLSTRDNGTIATTFPHLNQFNKVMAFVELDSNTYVLDGTDKYTPASLIPSDVMCTEGFVVDEANENDFRWQLLWNEKKLEKNTIAFIATIRDNGEMDGTVSIVSTDYARTKRNPYIKETQKAYLERFYVANSPNVFVDSLTFTNEANDTLPLLEKFVFHTPVSQSGEYTYFSANLFSELKINPFISDNRFSDVFFGTNQSHNIIASFIIPDGYEFEELPKNIRMTLEDKSLVVTRMVASTGNVLNTRITLDFKRPYYTPQEYPDLKEFYKKLYSLLDEQFVIKKKA